ncbi:hypothetical protein SAMN02799636_04650 [Methylobacterium sp. 275MFSha3.1]|nr:hypothetical protein SAMN02799636_04650 [Methylobacterium sp. 275MFSha3.1]
MRWNRLRERQDTGAYETATFALVSNMSSRPLTAAGNEPAMAFTGDRSPRRT